MMNSQEKSQGMSGKAGGDGNIRQRDWPLQKSLPPTNLGLANKARFNLGFFDVLIWIRPTCIIDTHMRLFIRWNGVTLAEHHPLTSGTPPSCPRNTLFLALLMPLPRCSCPEGS
jgi:hypothetical protein